MKHYFFIRTDTNPRIGTGHLMRCLALAQAWRKQGDKVTFISSCESESLRNRITDEGFQLVSIEKPYPEPDDLETTLLTINNSSSNNTLCFMHSSIYLIVQSVVNLPKWHLLSIIQSHIIIMVFLSKLNYLNPDIFSVAS